MSARTRQGFRNCRDFREQRIAIARQPIPRSPIRQGEARRGIARAGAAPERFRAHWRSYCLAGGLLSGVAVLALLPPLIIGRVVDDGQALSTALELAQRIAANGPMAVRVAKQLVSESPNWPAQETWARQNALLEAVINSEDAKEGARAFAEKRAPVWSGR
jgi:enoyl-CoA hydratase/carnithine racemase